MENTLCEQDPDGDYRLGLALYGFGKRVEAGLDLRVRSLPLLKELSETTNLTSFLWVRQGDQAICLERIDGRDSFSMAAEAGSGLPLHTGAAPRMLLALDKEEVIDDYLARRSPLRSFTAKTVTDPEALRRDAGGNPGARLVDLGRGRYDRRSGARCAGIRRRTPFARRDCRRRFVPACAWRMSKSGLSKPW